MSKRVHSLDQGATRHLDGSDLLARDPCTDVGLACCENEVRRGRLPCPASGCHSGRRARRHLNASGRLGGLTARALLTKLRASARPTRARALPYKAAAIARARWQRPSAGETDGGALVGAHRRRRRAAAARRKSISPPRADLAKSRRLYRLKAPPRSAPASPCALGVAYKGVWVRMTRTLARNRRRRHRRGKRKIRRRRGAAAEARRARPSPSWLVEGCAHDTAAGSPRRLDCWRTAVEHRARMPTSACRRRSTRRRGPVLMGAPVLVSRSGQPRPGGRRCSACRRRGLPGPLKEDCDGWGQARA